MDLIFWAEQNLYIEMLKSDIRFDIDKEFRKHNVQIPYPQTEIYVKPEPGIGSAKGPRKETNSSEPDPLV